MVLILKINIRVYLFYFKLTSYDGVSRVDLYDIRTCLINGSFCFIQELLFYYHFTCFLINDFYIRRRICIRSYG